MQPDPTVERIMEVRHKVSEHFGYDLKSYIRYLKDEEKKYKSRILKERSNLKESEASL